MKPGRELDILVAEKVMGIPKSDIDDWNLCFNKGESGRILWYRHDHLPLCSTDIAAAWEVVKKVGIVAIIKMNNGEYMARTDDLGKLEGYYERRTYKDDHATDYAFGITAPHAICLAALKSVGYDPG